MTTIQDKLRDHIWEFIETNYTPERASSKAVYLAVEDFIDSMSDGVIDENNRDYSISESMDDSAEYDLRSLQGIINELPI